MKLPKRCHSFLLDLPIIPSHPSYLERNHVHHFSSIVNIPQRQKLCDPADPATKVFLHATGFNRHGVVHLSPAVRVMKKLVAGEGWSTTGMRPNWRWHWMPLFSIRVQQDVCHFYRWFIWIPRIPYLSSGAYKTGKLGLSTDLNPGQVTIWTKSVNLLYYGCLGYWISQRKIKRVRCMYQTRPAKFSVPN